MCKTVEDKKQKTTRHLKSIGLIRECPWVTDSHEIVSAYNLMCFSCILWLISVQQTCWRLGAYRKLLEKICGNEPIVTHLLSLTFFLLAQTSHGMWPLSSSASAAFSPACLRLAAACGSFPGLAGMSGNVCCIRGAKSRLRPLSHAPNQHANINGWPTAASTHSQKPSSHHSEPRTYPEVQVHRSFIQTNRVISRSTQGLHPHNSFEISQCAII